MHRLTDWIEPLLEGGLNQYLSSKKAITLTQRPEQHFSVVEELSNLCIRPSTSQYLFLLEFPSSYGHVEAVLADSSSTVDAVVPRAAVKLWQTRTRSLLTSFPAGTLFHILESELRVSDCFLPPRIELWVNSFDIVGGLGNEVASTISEIGAFPTLRHLLETYTELHERRKITREDTVRMSSPLQSQESACSSNTSCREIDAEKSETKTSSQPFYTQISLPPAPKHRRQPLTPRQPRISPDIISNNRVSMPETSSLLLARNSAQASIAAAEDLPKTVGRASDQLRPKLQSQYTVQEPAASNAGRTNPPRIARGHQESIYGNGDHWPGGRTGLSNARYLPRHLLKVSKEQQEILETANAWQPSKRDRQIRGSIPNQTLQNFTELADKRPEIASEGSLNSEASPVTEESVEGVQLDCEKDRDPEDASADELNSQVSASPSWPSTPRSPARPEPALPENSSPLRAPPRKLSPSLSRNRSPVAVLGDGSHQEQSTENDLPVPSQRGRSVSAINQPLEVAETAACAQLLSESFQNAPDPVMSEYEIDNAGRMLSPERCLSQRREQGQLQDAEPSGTRSRQSNPDSCPKPRDSIPVASQTQRSLNHQKADGKILVQVQRTPFVHQLPRSMEGSGFCGHSPVFPYANTDESVPNDQEPKSSTPVVPGTFMYVQAKQRGQSEENSRGCLHDDSDSSEGERMEEEGMREIVDVSKAADAVDAAFEAHPWTTSVSESGSHKHSSQRRVGKRKYCNDDHSKARIELHQPTESRKPRSSPAPSKRARTMSGFPSLDALRDIATVRASSEVARESRRDFFRQQQRAASRPTPVQDETDLSREMSHFTQQGGTTPRISLLPRTGSRRESGVDTISRLSLKGQSMYDRYKANYPEYQGDALQFHKACKQIKILHRDGKAPHPSLWDDFIFRRHHDYRAYLLEVTEACEDAMPYLQYYSERVEKPSRMQLVVRPSYISSLGTGSAIGSSVMNPPVAAHNHIEAAQNLEESVAASSSASNVPPKQHTSSPAVACHHRQRQNLHHELDSHWQNVTEQTQDSSVKQWVELQSIERVLGAESPELGYTNVAAEEADVSQQALDCSAEILGGSSPHHQPVVPEQEEKESAWCDDPDTPFKTFARTYNSLASERRRLQRPVKIDEKGCLQPQLQNVIDIFTLYRR